MNDLPDKAPSASKTITAPADTDTDHVLSCTEDTIAGLARKDDRWDPRITHRDAAAGVIETGNFQEENESGFRARVQFDAGRNSVQVDLKGAGAYFTDLGVDAAVAEFSAALERCLWKPD
jgi:hypothetical protein